MLTKASAELTLFDTLSRLTFAKAVKLLGGEGSRLIMAGGKHDIDIASQVEFNPQKFRLAMNETRRPEVRTRDRQRPQAILRF